MRANGIKGIASFALFALGLATFLSFYVGSRVYASGQSGSAVEVKGLKDVRPITVTGRPDESAHFDAGWKLFLVGTNKYENLDATFDLHYAVQDVEAIRQRFIELGVPESNIVLLSSEKRGDLISHKENIEKAFSAYIASLEEGDAAFVYLSGHGFYFKTDKLPFYAPKNIKAESEATIRATGVSIENMIEQLKNSPAKFKWMTVDACRNDPTELFAKSVGIKALDISKSFVVNTGNLPESFVFMQGCEDGQFSLESPELEHGLLTHSLLEALQSNDNPAVSETTFELKLVDLFSYVQTRTDELAHLCRDSANRPLAQRPAITNDRLQNATLLVDLRHGGLTQSQWDLILGEESNFDNYLINNDLDRAQNALTSLAGYYPDGTNSERYQKLNKRLEEHRHNKEAEEYYQKAQESLAAKQYTTAKIYIDGAIELYNSSEYTKFRNITLPLEVNVAVHQAIESGDLSKAQTLNNLLAELNPQWAKDNAAKLGSVATNPEPNPEPNPVPNPEPDGILSAGALKTLTINGVDVNFHWAPAGTFQIGSPESEEGRFAYEKQREVTLSHGFWIAETETTQELWQAVMGNNPSFFEGEKQLPVENVTWEACLDFVKKLNSSYVSLLPSGYKFAIPTEAQWEYACRAGTTTPYSFGANLDAETSKRYGNNTYTLDLTKESPWKTQSVKSYAPNNWGLYDMHGNVMEWCSDWFDSDYGKSASTDPNGPAAGLYRVMRGGAWWTDGSLTRSASRFFGSPEQSAKTCGVRLVVVPESQADPSLTVQQSVNDQEPDASRIAGEIKTVEIEDVKVIFRWAPAGTFQMGSPRTELGRDGNERQHEVTLTTGFWIAGIETTQELWQAVMGNNPSHFNYFNHLPVENVSWNDCQAFVKKLNSDYRDSLPSGYKFSLPTEAQWEYACRAGTSTPFNFGTKLNGDKANCDGRSPYETGTKGSFQDQTSPGGLYRPNAWGLCDMHGNVWEWCIDVYDSDYYSNPSAKTDPPGPVSGSGRVMRGGSWGAYPMFCRSARRGFYEADFRADFIGFRLVLVKDSESSGRQSVVVGAREDKVNGAASAGNAPDGNAPESTRQAGALKALKINDVTVNFHWAPAGSFQMGSPKSEDGHDASEFQHEVKLSHGFWIAETETTQELWQAIMGNNPSGFKGSKQLPVESVTWDDCQKFLTKLNSSYGNTLPSGYKYALPTEAQWEYACRAGTTTPFSFGSSLNGDNANSDGTNPYGTSQKGKYIKKTTPVGSYEANAWGLYDMHGNVWEWTCDWYDADYYTDASASEDPTGPSSGSNRVTRGGSWLFDCSYSRSAYRGNGEPDRMSNFCGFRLVLVPESASAERHAEEVIASPERPEPDVSDATRNAGALKTLTINGVNVNFHWAPAGSFQMGSPESEDGRDTDEAQHKVVLTQGFWIAETETTQELWQMVMGENPSFFDDDDHLPVDRVSWNDCQEFLQKLNRAYSSALPNGYKYALPTEAQWEYACRAGTSTPFSFGDSLNGDKANCDGSNPYGTSSKGTYKEATTRVKSYAPNAWGLYDMHGNVMEFCADWHGLYDTSTSGLKDPVGAGSGTQRILRGGSWYNDAVHCRCAFREAAEPELRRKRFGFRLVLVKSAQAEVSQTEDSTSVLEAVVDDEPETGTTALDAVVDAAPAAGTLKTLKIAGVNVNFHWAPAGSFMMGSPESEQEHTPAEQRHEVTLTKGFWIAETETTQELWQAVMGNNRSAHKGSNLPVDNVSWNDCQEFLQTVNSRFSSVLPHGYQYALPTEAQWEYACRAGTTTPYSFGSKLNGDNANCDGSVPYGTNVKGDNKKETMPVMSYPANSWGLYDMHGNVWEWTADVLDFNYDTSAAGSIDPTGPKSGDYRVGRGGSWRDAALSSRSAMRGYNKPDSRDPDSGFRLVLVPEQSSRR